MRDFRDVPQPDLARMKTSVPIVRCNRANKFKLGFLCLSDRPKGTEVHFAGRTVPCDGGENGCKWCKIGRRVSWVGYVAACDHLRTKQFLVEITPGAMADILPFFDRWGSLRGCWVQLTRPSARDTGRVVSDVQRNALGLAPADIPRPVDVRQTLRKIWGLDDGPGRNESESVRNQGTEQELDLRSQFPADRISSNGRAS